MGLKSGELLKSSNPFSQRSITEETLLTTILVRSDNVSMTPIKKNAVAVATGALAFVLGAGILSGCDKGPKPSIQKNNEAPVATAQPAPASEQPVTVREPEPSKPATPDVALKEALGFYNSALEFLEVQKSHIEETLPTNTKEGLLKLSEHYANSAKLLETYQVPQGLDPKAAADLEDARKHFIEGFNGYAKYYKKLADENVPYPTMTDDHFSNVEKKGDFMTGRKDPIGNAAASDVGEAQHILESLAKGAGA